MGRIIIFILLLFTAVLFAIDVEGTLVGRVTDTETGEPLPGANVMIEGTLLGASAAIDGDYEIDHIPPGKYSVRATMMGYKSIKFDEIVIKIKGKSTVDFPLKETAIELDPVVVLAGKTEQRLDEAPVSISVVSARDIQKKNAVNLVQALEDAPGVNFIGDQINIRGSTGYTFGVGNKVLLLLDGVPVYASDTGQFNWDMLPPMDVEQIEILKGAGSTLWGASALGGVVNIITRDPSPEGKLMYSVSSGFYDEPYYDEWVYAHKTQWYNRQDVSYSKKYDKFGIRFSAGHYGTTGYHQLGDAEKYNYTGKMDYRFKSGIKLTGYAAFSNIHQGFFVQWKSQNDPYEVDPSNLGNYADTNQLNAYVKLAVPFSPTFALNVRASVVRSLMGSQFAESASFNPALGQGFEAQGTWLPHPDHVITIGTQFQQDAGSNKYFGDHQGFFVGPFVQDEWKIRSNLRMTTGLRYDRYQLRDGKREDLWSPRFGINWKPWPTTSLRASVGSGFRAATIVERFLELSIMNFKIKANPALRPEHSWAYDVGFRQYLNENWNVDFSFFLNDYTDLIEAHLDLIRGQIQFRNIERARIQGIEATMNWSAPTRWGKWRVVPSVVFTGTFMHHEELQWNEPLTYRPNNLINAKAMLKIQDFDIQLIYRYASEIAEVKVYPINDRVPMKFLDFRSSYDLGFISLQLGINNLLNYNYAPMESNLQPMRTFTIGLQGEF